MPLVRNYSAGSIIYFIGDVGEEVYVLQNGRIILMSASLDYKDDVKEDVRRGEFFGVKSALGHYPREETAQVLTESQVLVFKSAEFEQFALKNPKLVLTMLKVFSGQLRRVHKKVRELLGEGDMWETSAELINIAEYYYKQSKTDYALYGFEAYLKHYPKGHFAGRAQDMLQNLKKGVPYPLHFPSLDEEIAKMNGSAEGAPGDDAGFTPEMNTPASDFDAPFVDSGGGDFEPPPLDDDSGGFDLDSVSVAAPESASTLYFDALNQFSAGNFNDAIAAFQKIQDLKKVSREDVQYLEKSMFDMGRAWLKMRNAKKSLEVFSNFLKKYPNSELNRKAMMQMGEIYEAMKDMQRAAAFYSKVAKMQPEDKDSISAANKLKGMVKR